jgi:predicted RNA-binding Zn-ribbon protein involved in translation (DUF1610 family)
MPLAFYFSVAFMVVAIVLFIRLRHRITPPGDSLLDIHCPQCGEHQPLVRMPTSVRQAMLGGYTCQKCGCEMDRYGKPLADNHDI